MLVVTTGGIGARTGVDAVRARRRRSAASAAVLCRCCARSGSGGRWWSIRSTGTCAACEWFYASRWRRSCRWASCDGSLIRADAGDEFCVVRAELCQPFGVKGRLLFTPGDELLGCSDRRRARPDELLRDLQAGSRVRRGVVQDGMVPGGLFTSLNGGGSS
jgi:hypothetical protein